MVMIVIVKGLFQDKKRHAMELSTGKILEKNLVQSAFHQTLGDELNLKHKAKYTLELLTKDDIECFE
jgi:hypothetical protein